jgi:hypothetical protein
MPCMFCGATDRKMSNEHLWPQWIRRLLPPEAQKQGVRYDFDTDAGRVRSFDTRLFELKVKDVCEPCNSGWMSEYETNVQHWATGMLQGRGRHLHETGQRSIAAWAALKCLVGQRLYPQREIIPADHYRAVYNLREAMRPPDGAQVFTARATWSAGTAQPGSFASTAWVSWKLTTTPTKNVSTGTWRPSACWTSWCRSSGRTILSPGPSIVHRTSCRVSAGSGR